jgi:SMC interacting uncharacterized protein involved in chromosome segregation
MTYKELSQRVVNLTLQLNTYANVMNAKEQNKEIEISDADKEVYQIWVTVVKDEIKDIEICLTKLNFDCNESEEPCETCSA